MPGHERQSCQTLNFSLKFFLMDESSQELQQKPLKGFEESTHPKEAEAKKSVVYFWPGTFIYPEARRQGVIQNKDGISAERLYTKDKKPLKINGLTGYKLVGEKNALLYYDNRYQEIQPGHPFGSHQDRAHQTRFNPEKHRQK